MKALNQGGHKTSIDLYSSFQINHVIKVNLSVCFLRRKRNKKTCMP